MPGLNQVAVSRDESVPILAVIGAVSSRPTVFEVPWDGNKLSKYGILSIVVVK